MKNDEVQEFVDELDDALWRDSASNGSTRDKVMRRVGVVAKKCGWTKRSAPRVAYLQRLLSATDIFASPALDTPGLEVDSKIYFTRTAPTVTGMGFRTETELRHFLAKNVNRLDVFDGYQLKQQEYRLANGNRVDLLLEDKKGKRWLVVELEKEQKDESPVQLHRYMLEISGRGLPAGYTLEGMIISCRPTSSQVNVFNSTTYPGGTRPKWYQYSVVLNLTEVEGSIIDESGVGPSA